MRIAEYKMKEYNMKELNYWIYMINRELYKCILRLCRYFIIQFISLYAKFLSEETSTFEHYFSLLIAITRANS